MYEYPSFQKNILKYVDLSENELTKFSSCYSLEKVEKQNHLKTRWNLWIWRICTWGLFKVFYQENGREHILYFAIEDWWVLDIDSFVSDIEAIYSSTRRFCYSHNRQS
jgi:hypothetical protein